MLRFPLKEMFIYVYIGFLTIYTSTIYTKTVFDRELDIFCL